jgi:hypothetical protein
MYQLTPAQRQQIVDALEETTALCINFKSVEETQVYKFTEAPTVIGMGNEAIDLLRSLPEVSGEPVAFRFDFDGYGWQYRDNGSGSSWKDMAKDDAEFLFTAPQPAADVVNQIAEAARNHGLSLVKTATGYDLMKLGPVTALSAAQGEMK